ncbi:hypothetical protein [Candidatus Magnetominusculus dajiuhuensis]|uniref:hypothetical protein n=1 Tax=Candidatus Magnetominusculus dajiuhuensis TaxID=3137712 RepID=UPI003B42A840
MKRTAVVNASVAFTFAALVLLLCGRGLAADADYYARCNLKVLKGNKVTWLNWQASPTFIPAGTKLKVSKSGAKATLTDPAGEQYTLDIGSAGEKYLEKFVTQKPLNIDKYPKDVQEGIREAVARLDMTKEQVYVAMGPPVKLLSGDTETTTYEQIMGSNNWIYARRRMGKNIGVEFDPTTGKVIRTEGIWR